MTSFRNLIRIAESAVYPNLREIPGGQTFRAYHGSPDFAEFERFDPAKMNSRTGAAHGAFFFSGSRRTAMTYMDVEEVLKPEAQTKYDALMAQHDAEAAHLFARLNTVLTQHGQPAVKEMPRDLWTFRHNLTRDDEYGPLARELREIGEIDRWVYSIRKQAYDLQDRSANVRQVHTGILMTVEITARSVWEQDLDGRAFQVDRWSDLFNGAKQSDADVVILYNAVDVADDFGHPDTIYAVFYPDLIRITDRQVFRS